MSDAPIKPGHTLEIAHVLFTDIVGYSKLPMDEQEQLLMHPDIPILIAAKAEYAKLQWRIRKSSDLWTVNWLV
jgi:hypothetical protein